MQTNLMAIVSAGATVAVSKAIDAFSKEFDIPREKFVDALNKERAAMEAEMPAEELADLRDAQDETAVLLGLEQKHGSDLN